MEKRSDLPKFTFLVHWVENWNLALHWSQALRKNPKLKKFWLPLWPLFALMSLFYLFGKKSHQVIDRFTFDDKLEGEIRILRNLGWHFFVKNQRNKIKKRILDAVLMAQAEGSQVVGLGALNKAEWLTAGGKWIVDSLGDKLKIPVVHGDTLTAATICKMLLSVLQIHNQNKVFLTGATSKIGRALALVVVTKKVTVKCYTSSQKRFDDLQKEAGENGIYLVRAKNLTDGADCNIWLTGKAIPAGKKLLKAIPQKAIVVNFSVPNPLSESALKKRPDLRVVEGGLLAYDTAKTNFSFTMRLKSGLTYACHAGTMVHAHKGWKHHEVGPVKISDLAPTWKAAEELGFFIPEFEVASGRIMAGGKAKKIRFVPSTAC